MLMKERFRGFYPVVVDVETGGLNPQHDALLEMAIVLLGLENDKLVVLEEHSVHLDAAPGLNISAEALKINQIIPDHPFRFAVPEKEGLESLFALIRAQQKAQECKRSILVGHNAWFDLHFMNAAIERNGIKKNPFHAFSSFDTATLAGAVLGETVLAKALIKSGLGYDEKDAHSALYDARKTAELFCYMVNRIGYTG